MLVMAISMVMGAMVIPSIRSTMANYQLSAAVDSASGAIQTTRYQAIMQGYPYQVAFSSTNNTFQVLSQAPPATSFSNVGSAVPLAGIPIVVSANTTLQFKANGAVTAPVGGMSFTISYKGKTKTLTVSNYGSITVQ
jgi:Tfp pilus assembly protein FimT